MSTQTQEKFRLITRSDFDGLVTAAGESIREVLFQPDSPFGKQQQADLQDLMVDDLAALKRNLARRDEGPDAGQRK